jgi:O-antigen/teichoic acid export membrane protein
MQKRELFTIIEAVLFLIGAVFLVVNITADTLWTFIAGIVSAALSIGIWMFLFFWKRKKKTREPVSNN